MITAELSVLQTQVKEGTVLQKQAQAKQLAVTPIIHVH